MGDVYLPGRKIRTPSRSFGRSVLVWGTTYVAISVTLAEYLGVTLWLAILLGLAPPKVHGTAKKRRLQAFERAATGPAEAIRSGNAAGAERDFADLQRRFRWPRYLPRLAGYNRALALMHLGKLHEAIELLADIDRRGGVVGYRGAIAGALSHLHALLGNLEVAVIWLDEARRRDVGFRHKTRFPYVMPEAVLALRAGDAQEARVFFDSHWREMEETLQGDRLRPLRLLRAFATVQGSDVRDAAAVTPLVAGLKASGIDDVAYLWAAWPELEAFARCYIV